MSRSTLEGKHLLLIGGASGIGLAVARMAQTEGAIPLVVARREASLTGAREVLGDKASMYVADLSDHARMDAILDQVDRVDHLFSTAGAFLAEPTIHVDEDEARSVFEGRFWSVVRLLRKALPKMPADGSVVFMSGTANWRPEGSPIAMATLGAIESFARAMAAKHGPIRFNCIAPGLTDTPFLRQFLGDDATSVLAGMAGATPLGRFGTAEEVADAVLFLMRNSYVNAETLNIDGGARLV
ncbi:MAG: SDR family oxidoreductase [Pseudomonadales bacterium]